ncbi:MAG: hypothetical protein M3539_04615 [Acidobacteriota bacterium]|nr:hypothetical protein [Acidobacteriota bacterium]
MTAKTFRLLLIALFLLAIAPGAALAQKSTATKTPPRNQLAETRSELIAATETYKASAQEVVRFQEEELTAATKRLEDLRQLVADGLVARNELTAGEQEVASAKAKLEGTRKQIADSENLIAQIKEAEQNEKEFAKTQAAQAATARKLVRPVSLRYNGMAAWALANISSVQSFFTATFGRVLPISTFGQSATHNAMRWDHRNAVDVGLHPDSAEGRALVAYLQSKGIPFLAFRGAVPGVSTGPHIHIGYPSSRLG